MFYELLYNSHYSSKNRHVCANRHLSHLALHTLILLPCSVVVCCGVTWLRPQQSERQIFCVWPMRTPIIAERKVILAPCLLITYARLIAVCFLMRKRLKNNVHFLKLSVAEWCSIAQSIVSWILNRTDVKIMYSVMKLVKCLLIWWTWWTAK